MEDILIFYFESHLEKFEIQINQTITCDVDICVRDRSGEHLWPSCKTNCDGVKWMDQSADESDKLFALTTTASVSILTLSFFS